MLFNPWMNCPGVNHLWTSLMKLYTFFIFKPVEMWFPFLAAESILIGTTETQNKTH